MIFTSTATVELANGTMQEKTGEKPSSNAQKRFADRFTVRLPDVEDRQLDQDEEYLMLKEGTEERKLRFHDYDKIYEIPGLYEYVFYEELECCSPETIAELLSTVLKRKSKVNARDLRCLDVGAGNGMAAEALKEQLGVYDFLGVDINPEAKMAAERDRAGIYDGYLAADLTALTDQEASLIGSFRPNLLLCVAALGFGDIPAEAFVRGYNFVEKEGILAFNLRDVYLDKSNRSSEFANLIHRAVDEGHMVVEEQITYRHRYALNGDELNYVGMVAIKRKDIPDSWL